MKIEIIDISITDGKRMFEIVRREVGQIPGELTFELSESEEALRDPTLDPTVLVAVVSGISSAITALLAGLLRILERRRPTGKIIIQCADKKIEVPVGASNEQIEFLVHQLNELEIKRIILSS